MTGRAPTLVFLSPIPQAELWTVPLAQLMPELKVAVHGRDSVAPETVDYTLLFRPPPGFLAQFPNLRTVFSFGAGVDSILADGAYPKHIPLVRFVDELLSRAMAQYCVMHTLILHRRQRDLDSLQCLAKWRMLIPKPASDIRVGILGLGVIGQETAKILRDLGYDVAGWSRTRKDIDGIASFAGRERDAFLARSDILICLLPLTPETRGILNRETIMRLPTGAAIINAARGGHQVEHDLLEALDSGQLSHAVLDVFDTEPLPPDHPFWRHPKVTVTPHCAGLSDPNAVARSVTDNIRRIERGEQPLHLVDLERGY